ncbi:MAG: hypothetical protein IKP47_09375 [Ruminococcus sp.]|nr:hypothetical protein [Ruminococcus sp.]
MEPKNYRVVRIDGDYAVLAEIKTGEEQLTARALLSEEIEEGSLLHWENLCYTITE